MQARQLRISPSTKNYTKPAKNNRTITPTFTYAFLHHYCSESVQFLLRLPNLAAASTAIVIADKLVLGIKRKAIMTCTRCANCELLMVTCFSTIKVDKGRF